MLVIMVLGFTTAFTGHIYGYTGGPYQVFQDRLDGSSSQPNEYDIGYDQRSYETKSSTETPSTQDRVIGNQYFSSEQTCEDVFGIDNQLCAAHPPEPPDAHDRTAYPTYRPG